MTIKSGRFSIVVFVVLIFAVVLIAQVPIPSPSGSSPALPPSANAIKAEQIYKDIQVLKGVPADEIMPTMRVKEPSTAGAGVAWTLRVRFGSRSLQVLVRLRLRSGALTRPPQPIHWIHPRREIRPAPALPATETGNGRTPCENGNALAPVRKSS